LSWRHARHYRVKRGNGGWRTGSLLAQKFAQGFVAVRSDIGDSPTHLELDQSKNKRALIAQTFE
jgi:hypothetical protein